MSRDGENAKSMKAMGIRKEALGHIWPFRLDFDSDENSWTILRRDGTKVPPERSGEGGGPVLVGEY